MCKFTTVAHHVYLCMGNQTEQLQDQGFYQQHSATLQHQQRRGTQVECWRHLSRPQTWQTLANFWLTFLACCPAQCLRQHQEPPTCGPAVKVYLVIYGLWYHPGSCSISFSITVTNELKSIVGDKGVIVMQLKRHWWNHLRLSICILQEVNFWICNNTDHSEANFATIYINKPIWLNDSTAILPPCNVWYTPHTLCYH